MRYPGVFAVALLLFGSLPCVGQEPTGPPDAIRRSVKAPENLPRAQYVPVKAWPARATGHKTGRPVEDPDAEGGAAWEAGEGQDGADALLYGPYLEIDPGDYVGFFRVKRLETQDEDLGRVDACVGYGQEMLASHDLAGADLTPGKYVEVPLLFHYEKGKLECRFQWSGCGSLRVDRVSLFRLVGARMDPGAGRAPEARPAGVPTGLAYSVEPRPFPDIFPRSAAPARELVVCDLQTERPDARLLLLGLQGLVNRKQPRLYCLSVATDAFWLQQMRECGHIAGTVAATRQEVLARFRDAYQGVVITDPGLPASKNVATMLAGVKDGLIASPRLAGELGLPVLEDLRGRWQTSAEAYRWAFDHLWPRLNHHVIACLWPGHLGLRDYLVANRVFLFWISGPLDGARAWASPTDEARLMEGLLAKMPANIPVMGYPWAGKDVGIGEGPGVTLFAEFGKYLVGSIDCTNLTVHSGIRVPELRQQPAPPPPALQDDKVYVAVILSDGDNLPVLTLHNFPQLWQEKARGRLPMGWTLSPAASVLLPDVVEYYYRTATAQDQFLGAVSGVGYTYPDSYGKRYRAADRRRVYDGFLDQTGEYMRRCDLQALWAMNATRPEIIARYAERIPFLDGLFLDYGRRLSDGAEATYPTARNVPVFHAVCGWREEDTRQERIERLAAEVRRMTPPQRPAFLHLFVWNWGADLALLQEVLRQLGPEYVAVRPDHLAQLWRTEMARQHVLARFPGTVPALDDRPVTLRGVLRNMTQARQQVQVRVVGGLDGASVHPARMTLAPSEEKAVVLAGRPAPTSAAETRRAEPAPAGAAGAGRRRSARRSAAGAGGAASVRPADGAARQASGPAGDSRPVGLAAGRVEIAIAGAFGERRASAGLRLIRTAELAAPLPAGTLSPAACLEAAGLPHRSGKAEADPDAMAGAAWVARKGEAEPGYILFGPYAPLEAGRYVALFRMKAAGEGSGTAAVLDACVGGGKPQTGRLEVKAADLPACRYRVFPVTFDHPGGTYEVRVSWPGTVPLVLDSISVWRVGK